MIKVSDLNHFEFKIHLFQRLSTDVLKEFSSSNFRLVQHLAHLIYCICRFKKKKKSIVLPMSHRILFSLISKIFLNQWIAPCLQNTSYTFISFQVFLGRMQIRLTWAHRTYVQKCKTFLNWYLQSIMLNKTFIFQHQLKKQVLQPKLFIIHKQFPKHLISCF